MTISNRSTATPTSPMAREARIRWPVEETGRNSVNPSTTPSIAACPGVIPSRRGLEGPVHRAKRVAHLAQRHARLHRVDHGRSQVHLPPRAFRQPPELVLHPVHVPLRLERADAV